MIHLSADRRLDLDQDQRSLRQIDQETPLLNMEVNNTTEAVLRFLQERDINDLNLIILQVSLNIEIINHLIDHPSNKLNQLYHSQLELRQE